MEEVQKLQDEVKIEIGKRERERNEENNEEGEEED